MQEKNWEEEMIVPFSYSLFLPHILLLSLPPVQLYYLYSCESLILIFMCVPLTSHDHDDDDDDDHLNTGYKLK